MTLYQDLPVYRTSYELLLLVYSIVKQFTRDYKYTLWDKIKNQMIELVTTIYKANSSQKKRIYNISKAREQVEVLRLYFRLSNDLQIIGRKKFIELNQYIESVSKQLYAWEQSTKK